MSDASQTLASPSPRPFTRSDLPLATVVLFSWSTGWIALHYQLGVVSPEVSVAWRHLLAGGLMTLWCLARRESMLGFSLRDHGIFALLGATLFSANFVFFYYAGQTLVSGMLSVLFALVAPGNVLVQAFGLRQPVPMRSVLGALVGVCGVALLFWPEISGAANLHQGMMTAIGFGLLGTSAFCIGNLISAKGSQRGIPVFPATAWGMFYAVGILLLIAVLSGQPILIETTPAYLGSLFYLALVPSLAAFAAYLTLMKRTGPASAGYLTVLFPVFALAISAVVEGYQWSLWSIAGLVAVGIGNLLVLRR